MAKNNNKGEQGPGVFVSVPRDNAKDIIRRNDDGTYEIKAEVGVISNTPLTDEKLIKLSIGDDHFNPVSTTSFKLVTLSSLKLKPGSSVVLRAQLAGTDRFNDLSIKVPQPGSRGNTSGEHTLLDVRGKDIDIATGHWQIFIQFRDKREAKVHLDSPKKYKLSHNSPWIEAGSFEIDVPKEGLRVNIWTQDDAEIKVTSPDSREIGRVTILKALC